MQKFIEILSENSFILNNEITRTYYTCLYCVYAYICVSLWLHVCQFICFIYFLLITKTYRFIFKLCNIRFFIWTVMIHQQVIFYSKTTIFLGLNKKHNLGFRYMRHFCRFYSKHLNFFKLT